MTDDHHHDTDEAADWRGPDLDPRSTEPVARTYDSTAEALAAIDTMIDYEWGSGRDDGETLARYARFLREEGLHPNRHALRRFAAEVLGDDPALYE